MSPFHRPKSKKNTVFEKYIYSRKRLIHKHIEEYREEKGELFEKNFKNRATISRQLTLYIEAENTDSLRIKEIPLCDPSQESQMKKCIQEVSAITTNAFS